MELPKSVQEVAEVIGRERALYLIGRLAGQSRRDRRVMLYVPKRLNPDHKLVRLIGWHDADRLVRAFGGEIMELSTFRMKQREHRNSAMRRMAVQGISNAEIADTFGTSERQVRRILAANDNGAVATQGGRTA